ncbi:MAG: hypothetical protein K9N48_09065, partial [Verrucomicrobia bacterium]|nr:hypothetical protein [Verrucomicrobiota bacterium]
DQPLFLRVKFQTSRSMMETLESIIYDTAWRVGPVDSPSTWRTNRSLTANAFHEIRIPAGMLDNEGKLRVEVGNPNDEALMFPLDNGIEVLYREASFGVNFIRGLLIIYFWIGLLAAVGLAAASFLSFPVAAFCSVTILILGMSTGLMSRVVSEGTVLGVNHETGEAGSSFIDWFAVPFFKAVLEVVGFAKGFSPIDALSTGTSIPWSEVGLAFFRLIMVMSGFAAALGMIIFTRRELATAQLSR